MQRLHAAKALHGALSSSKRLMRVLRAIVEPAADLSHRRPRLLRDRHRHCDQKRQRQNRSPTWGYLLCRPEQSNASIAGRLETIAGLLEISNAHSPVARPWSHRRRRQADRRPLEPPRWHPSLQHFQRPTPSRHSTSAPRASRGRDDHAADRSRSGLTIPAALTLRVCAPERDNASTMHQRNARFDTFLLHTNSCRGIRSCNKRVAAGFEALPEERPAD
jgi:hypothetical protein